MAGKKAKRFLKWLDGVNLSPGWGSTRKRQVIYLEVPKYIVVLPCGCSRGVGNENAKDTPQFKIRWDLVTLEVHCDQCGQRIALKNKHPRVIRW